MRQILFIFFFFFVSVDCFGQVIQFDNEKLSTCLSILEEKLKVKFNYNSNSIEGLYFNGSLDLKNKDEALEKLLGQTPLAIDQQKDIILLYLPEKQNFKIQGKVIDGNGEALPFVNIYLKGTYRGIESKIDGSFVFEFEAHKDEEIVFKYLAYEDKIIPLSSPEFKSLENKLSEVQMKVDPQLLNLNIVVKDYILNGITVGNDYGSTNMHYESLAQNYSAQEHDVLKTIQLLPGLNSPDESASNINIRGASSDQSLISWEGATLYDAGHMFGMISSINPFVVDDIKVYKSVFDVAYDNRVGGVIDVSLSNDVDEKLKAGFGSTFTEAHAYVNAPLFKNKSFLLLSARKSIGGDLLSPTMESYVDKVFQGTKVEENLMSTEEEEGVDSDDSFFNFYDINAKFLYQVNDKLSLWYSFFKSRNEFFYEVEFDEEELLSVDDSEFENEAMSGNLAYKWNEHNESKIQSIRSVFKNRYGFFQRDDSFESEHLIEQSTYNDILDLGLKVKHKITFSELGVLTVGGDFERKKVNYNLIENSNLSTSYEDLNYIESDFLNLHASYKLVKNKFLFNIGNRSTFHFETNDWSHSPRLNAQFTLSKSLKLKAAGGVFKQFISQLHHFAESELNLNNNIWTLSHNEEDGAISSEKLMLGFIFDKKGWLLDIEGYRNLSFGLNSLNTQIGSTELEFISDGESAIFGLDLLLKKRIKNYKFWINYSLSSNKILFPNYEMETFSANNDQLHKMSIVNQLTLNKWNIALTAQYKSGLPYSEPEDDYEEYIDEENEENLFELQFDDINEERLADYLRFDLSLTYRRSIFKNRMKGEFSFSIINLLNRRNHYSRSYFIRDDEATVEDDAADFYIDKYLLRRTPQVLFRIYW